MVRLAWFLPGALCLVAAVVVAAAFPVPDDGTTTCTTCANSTTPCPAPCEYESRSATDPAAYYLAVLGAALSVAPLLGRRYLERRDDRA